MASKAAYCRDFEESWRASQLVSQPFLSPPAGSERAVCFLASDEADYVTGQTMWVDGGSGSVR